jgi:hypothetical protein
MQIEFMNMNLTSPLNTGFMSDPLEDSSFG